MNPSAVELVPQHPRPIRWPVVPRAAYTVWHGGIYAFYRAARDSTLGRVLASAVITFFALCAVELRTLGVTTVHLVVLFAVLGAPPGSSARRPRRSSW